MSMMQVLL